MFIVSAYGIAFLCVFLTNCRPISYPWNPMHGGSCRDLSLEETASVSVNMVIDTSIVILPMPPLWGLQMPFRKKFAISGLFGLGLLLVCHGKDHPSFSGLKTLINVNRVVALMGWRVQISVQSNTQTDFVYGLNKIAIVTLLEVWLGITVACLPTITPLFSRYLRPLLSRISGFSGKRAAQRQLQEAKHTIGSLDPRGFSKKNFNRLNKDSLLELEEGQNLSSAEAATGSQRISPDEDKPWMSHPNSIGAWHDVEDHGEPKRHWPSTAGNYVFMRARMRQVLEPNMRIDLLA